MKIGVIGAGISGLSTAWILKKNGHDVTIFEKDTVGGHTLTYDVTPDIQVDIGFQVFNFKTYPQFSAFMDYIGITSEQTEMSFSVKRKEGEWSSNNLFANHSFSFYKMLYEILCFGRENFEKLSSEITLSMFLKQRGYSTYFKDNYIVPLCASIWSANDKEIETFPMKHLAQFMRNHHLLDIFNRPVWRVITNRSRTYVQKLVADIANIIKEEVHSVNIIKNNKIAVRTKEGLHTFDSIVFAIHADQILNIQSNIDEVIIDLLKDIRFSSNKVVLHKDVTLMPKSKFTWASWNCSNCVTYWLNNLQRLPPNTEDLFVTLNPDESQIDPAKVIKHFQMSHPIIDIKSVAAINKLTKIHQGKNNIYFAGAWCRFGFHEDGLASAINVATFFGAIIPWNTNIAHIKKTTYEQYYFYKIFISFAKSWITKGKLQIILPSGHDIIIGSTNEKIVIIRVLDMAFFKKVVLEIDVGIGEAYIEGMFHTYDLEKLLTLFAINLPSLSKYTYLLGPLQALKKQSLFNGHLKRENTIQGSRKNIEAHYDAGNAMYSLFLDKSMTYSSGFFQDNFTLYDAQMKKIDMLIEKANISKHDHVLEIGCGWGGFAIRAAQKIGCKVTGITISREQLEEANRRVKEAGVQHLVKLIYCDYRHVKDKYDKVVSIEMIEAVGKEHINLYMHTISKVLKPNGKAVIQAICVPDHRYNSYCNSTDFIREHIFPGGHLLSLSTLYENASGMQIIDVQDIGQHYARTIKNWLDSWRKNKERIIALNYSDEFWRKFEMYFAYCIVGFETKLINVLQIVFEKTI